MSPTGSYSWADLHSELLISIATATSGLSLRDYKCLRGVCTAWRSALPPPPPCCLLSLADNGASAYPSKVWSSLHHNTSFSTFDGERDMDVRNRPSVAGSGNGGSSVCSLPSRRSFNLGMETGSTVDGYGHASIFSLGLQRRIRLKTDTSSTEFYSRTRIVGSGSGRFAVAVDHGKSSTSVSFWTDRILLVCPRTGEEVKLVRLPRKDYECVRKIVFAPDPDDGTVVAMCHGQKIAYIDSTSSRRDMNWTTVDVDRHLVDLVFDDTGGGKLYCLDSYGGVRVILIPRGGRNKQDAPATVTYEPSLTLLSVRRAAAFAPPYDAVSRLTHTKHLFFCHGSLYQMWQNTSVTVNLSNGFTMSPDEIFVLRYDFGGWNAVKDLGGCSVFIGKNSSPAVVRAAGGAFLGVRPDCVYWIDWQDIPMVCDVATGTSKPYVDLRRFTGSTCWYFDAGNMTSSEET